MKKVESFNLDHTKVRAPYVRLAGQYVGPKGDKIRKFDLRLVQPNHEVIPTDALHTMEHLMASYLREGIDDKTESKVIDASPMGCRTGFYLTVLGDASEEQARDAFAHALQAIAEYDGEIPGRSELECGNYVDHDLAGARVWAQKVLTQPLIIQETVVLS